MKPTNSQFLPHSVRAVLTAFQAMALSLFVTQAQAGNTWTGGGGTNNWSDNSNWGGSAPGYGTLTFSGTTRISNVNDSITSMNQVNWSGTAAWSMTGGTTLSLFDNGGTQAKLEATTTGGVTINAPITFAANNGGPPNPYGEINAINSDISFTGSTLTVNGSSVNGIKFWGGNGRDVSFGNTVSATGKWFATTNATSQSVTIASGANVTTGDFYVMNGGTLRLAGGTLTTSAVRLGGDFGNTGNQNQALGGTLALTPSTGGVSFGSTINTVSGNTSNALLVDSQNTSGTNTLTSGIFLDSDLKIQQAAGGALATSTGTFDIKARQLAVEAGAGGNVTIGQALTSSLGAGGTLVKQGVGTLTLSSTSNTYTGTNSATLNASGTQIAGGTLAIAGDTSLGLAPSGAYNNIQFTGSGTLRTNDGISLHANRNISIAGGQTASFENFDISLTTINGVINGSGGVGIKSGSGVIAFSGNNTYSGVTTINSGGVLLVNANNALGSDVAGTTVNSGGQLRLSGVNYSTTEALTINGIGVGGFGAVVNGGTSTYAGEITAASSSTISAGNGGTLTLTGGLVNDGTTLTLTSIGGGGFINVNSAISGASAGSNLVVDAVSVTLNDTNTYSGTTTISSGTLQIGNGGSTGSLGAGSVTNNGALVFNRSGNINVNNAIGGSGTLTQSGGNIITISSANTYTGATTVNSGTLRVTANDALGTNAAGTTVNDGGSLRLSGVHYSTVEALSISGQGSIISGTASGALNNGTLAPDSSTYAGPITVAGTGATIKVSGASQSITLTGGVVKNGTTLIIAGNGSVIVNSTGISGAAANSDLVVDTATLVVNAASNYNGPTTVQNGGALVANAAIDTTNLIVNSGSTLSGTASVTAASGGSLFLNGQFIVGDSTLGSPVVSNFAAITSGAGSTVAGNNSTLSFDLFMRGGDLTANPLAADSLSVTGSLSLLSSVVLEITSSLTGWAYGDQWNLWDVSGTTTGTIASISAPAPGPGLVWSFNESSGVLSIVPEPSRALLMLFGVLGFGLRRRRA